MPIDTPRGLREHLELAIAVELSTVPPYLYAMYSLEDRRCDAALLIRSVVAEEMLHAALATNLLLAVGGEPDFSSTRYMPSYPSQLPHHRPPLTLNLTPCTKEQVENLFLVIEQPETHTGLPDDDIYDTLGQFYHAIEKGLATVAESYDVFADPQSDRQMARHSYYRPVAFDAEDSGGLGLIANIEAANAAIHVIIHQGEGVSDVKWADPLHQELTHYYKFLQIARGEAPVGTILPLPTNPRAASYPRDARIVAELFNAAYRYVYLVMHEIFQPTSHQERWVAALYTLMSDVLSPVAHHLTTMSLPGGLVAAPTFETYDFGDADPVQRLAELAEAAVAVAPALGEVTAAIATLATADYAPPP